jgi:hypothetical protein
VAADLVGVERVELLELLLGGLASHLELSGADHGRLQERPLARAVPALPADERGRAHGAGWARPLQKVAISTVPSMQLAAPLRQRLARQARPLRQVPRRGAVVDHRVDVSQARLAQRLVERLDLPRDGIAVALVAPDLPVGRERGGVADALLHPLRVGGDPGAVVARQIDHRAGVRPEDGVEAGRARQAEHGEGIVALAQHGDRALPVLRPSEDIDDDVQGGPLHLGDQPGPLG